MKKLHRRKRLSEKQGRLLLILIPTVLLAMMGIGILILKIKYGIGVTCRLNAMTGLYCPGCGGTRMTLELLHLNFHQAFRYNPFIFISIPVLVVTFSQQCIKYIKTGWFSGWFGIFLSAYALIILVYGVIRNFAMFSYLAPTVIN